MSEEEPATRESRSKLALFVCILGLVVGGILAATMDLRTGGLVTIASIVVAGAIISLGNPPPPKQGGDHPASMNFGR